MYLFFIRPRRFGKSLWLSTLECYYDIAATDEFDTLFAGTYIHDHPTAEKNKLGLSLQYLTECKYTDPIWERECLARMRARCP